MNPALRHILGYKPAASAPSVAYANFGYRGSDVANGGTDVYSFPGMALGTAAANRQIIVGVASDSQAFDNPLNMLIGAVSFQHVVGGTDGNNFAGVYIANVPTGTTGQIDIELSAPTIKGCAITVWSVEMSSEIAHNTSSGTVSAGTALNLASSIIPAGGFGVVIGENENARIGTINQSFTERLDLVNGGDLGIYAADLSTAMASATIGITLSGAANGAACFASWNGLGT